MTATNIANRRNLGYVGSEPAVRGTDDWYTPTPYLDSVRGTLGGINLDPFSSAHANELVKADRFYTEADNAFVQSWEAVSVFMNPPYTGSIVKRAVNTFVDKFFDEEFMAGIVLVNNATETQWFQRCLREADQVCFTDHRISFWNADGKRVSGNTRGQAFFLFGAHLKRPFRNQFAQHGKVVTL